MGMKTVPMKLHKNHSIPKMGKSVKDVNGDMVRSTTPSSEIKGGVVKGKKAPMV